LFQLSVPSSKKRQILPRSNFNPEVPTKAMIKLPPAKDTFSASIRDSYIASDQLTMYAGSVLSIPISYHEDEDNQDTLVPLRSEPDSVIRGKIKSNNLFIIISHNIHRWIRHCIPPDASK
jgi:WD repeat-containing protein 48